MLSLFQRIYSQSISWKLDRRIFFIAETTLTFFSICMMNFYGTAFNFLFFFFKVRELEGEMEKDQDSVAVGKGEIESCSDYLAVDIASLRRAYKELSSVPASEFEDAFVRALLTLAGNLVSSYVVGVRRKFTYHNVN